MALSSTAAPQQLTASSSPLASLVPVATSAVPVAAAARGAACPRRPTSLPRTHPPHPRRGCVQPADTNYPPHCLGRQPTWTAVAGGKQRDGEPGRQAGEATGAPGPGALAAEAGRTAHRALG